MSLGIVGLAIAAAIWMFSTRPVAPMNEPNPRAVSVDVIEVSPSEAVRRVRGYGSVRAAESADVAARVDGLVVSRGSGVREGERVEAGQLLIELDGDDAARQLEAASRSLAALEAQRAGLDIEERALGESLRLAESELVLARDDAKRVEHAFADGVALQRELDRARTAVLTADRGVTMAREAFEMVGPRRVTLQAQADAQRAAAERAKLSVERSRITSPIAGVVQSLPIEVGEMVGPGVIVARVVDPAHLELPARLPASSRAMLTVGQHAEATASDGTAATGTVVRLSPEDDPASRTFVAWIELPVGAALVPGAFTEVEVSAPDSIARTIVPRRSVRHERLLVVDGDRLRPQPVRVAFAMTGVRAASGVDDEEWLVLEEPLPQGTLIVLDASRRLDPAAPVVPRLPGAPLEPSAAPSAAPAVEPVAEPAAAPAAVSMPTEEPEASDAPQGESQP